MQHPNSEVGSWRRQADTRDSGQTLLLERSVCDSKEEGGVIGYMRRSCVGTDILTVGIGHANNGEDRR